MGNSAVFQRIAAITHQEEKIDPELLKVINIALYSIGNDVHATEMDSSISMSSNIDLINKARRTYYLIRKVNGIFPTSGTIYTTEYMKKMSLGYEEFLAYVASEASILPKSMYTEVRYVLDQHSILGLMMGYRISGSENLYQKLGEMLLKGMKGKEIGSLGAINGQSMESKMLPSSSALKTLQLNQLVKKFSHILRIQDYLSKNWEICKTCMLNEPSTWLKWV